MLVCPYSSARWSAVRHDCRHTLSSRTVGMTVYLGLGSNLGDRRANIARALDVLTRGGQRVLRVSPVVESPAMRANDAPADWNRPFLNAVAECSTDDTPDELLARLKAIELELGRG